MLRPGESEPPPTRRRVHASLLDFGWIVGWLVAVAVVAAAVRSVTPATATLSLGAAHLVVFATTVLPVGAYLTLTEGGPRQAGWGKRRAGLRVVGPEEGPVGLGRAAVRNAVKLLPWHLGHYSAIRFSYGETTGWLTWGAYALAIVLPTLTVMLVAADGWRRRALHDRVAGTRVLAAR